MTGEVKFVGKVFIYTSNGEENSNAQKKERNCLNQQRPKPPSRFRSGERPRGNATSSCVVNY